jgi:hypothetical protein
LKQEKEDFSMDEIPGLVKCHCGNMWITEKGDAIFTEKLPDGKQISEDAAYHKAEFWVRCPDPSCERIFCYACQESPYHDGFTCRTFKENKELVRCWNCKDVIEGFNGDLNNPFCMKEACQREANGQCSNTLDCTHGCRGYKGEEVCLPCLNEQCVRENPEKTLGLNEFDFCQICWVSGLGDRPSIKLGCDHIFHVECLLEKIKNKWSGPWITFSYLDCPSCKQIIQSEHPEIKAMIDEGVLLKAEI